jgi:aldehyde dehydrogenase (NAD+)
LPTTWRGCLVRSWDTSAPFGGYKQSGNGREYADWGIHDFCEVKGIVGYGD